ncbi:dihydropyrimidinase [Clostridium sp.]|uniref:dihydropyrimidinase n=1 Tax=Clostridium sp. TaxID=1506 RepID=UPI00346420CA
MKTLIKNGTIATASDVFVGDIYIEDGIIKEIGVNLKVEADEVIDASGKFVIPGGVDVHTHFDLDVGIARASDDFYTGTRAAACGGTTSVVDHIGFGPVGCSLNHQIDEYHKLSKDKAVIDYSFHGVIQHVNDEVLNDMEELLKEGISSYKFYLTYGFKVSDEEAFKVLLKSKEIGSIVTVHPENNDTINYLREDFVKKGLKSPIYHSKSRPVECEGEAINRMLNLASLASDSPLYIVHLSCKLGLDYINMARGRGQENVYAETCPQYLLLDEERYNLPDNEGLKYIMSPPLREAYNKDALWDGIRDGSIQVVATDHCPFNFNKEKQMGKDDFTKCPNGAPGVETRVPLLFSEGVMKNRISINKFVEVISTNPAKIFGLYPKKGSIMVGSDADIVIIDKEKKVTITKDILHENVDYTPYEGFELQGYPVLTMVRGKVVMKDNEFFGEKGYGEFIKRKPYCRN